MRNLKYYFSNPFYAHDISYNEMAAFGTDTIGRMVANPLPELNLLIAPLQVTLTKFMGTVSGDSGKGAFRKMAKANKDAYRDLISNSLTDTMVEVRYVLRDEPETALLEFIPDGLTAFRRLTDDGVAPELVRFHAALVNRSDKISAATISNWQDILDGWEAVYTASETATAEKAMTEQERRDARTGIADELFKVLNALTGLFPNDPDKVGLYMQQSLLGGPSTETPPGSGGGGDSSDSGEDPESSSDSEPMSSSSFSSSSSSEFESSSSEPSSSSGV